MLITLSEGVLKYIHHKVIQQRGEPGYLSEGMIQGCVERSITYVYGFQPFPTEIEKAAALMYSIIVFHPFIDGNKRTALIATYWFLHLNGYTFSIPDDTADFLKAVAEFKISEEQVAYWIYNHSKRDPFLILSNWIYSVLIKKRKASFFGAFMESIETLMGILPPGYPEVFRR